VPEARPPLDGMFAGRFDSEWTPAIEAALVSTVVENRLLRHRETEKEDIAAFIFSNQQESILLQGPHLGLEAVKQITRKRRS